MNRTRIGDLGCLGVDIDAWQEANRCPMYPDKTNRWLLLRTMRDGADDAEIRNTLQAVLAKWLSDVPSGWSPIGERAGHIRVGPADNITVERIVSERLALEQRARSREDLTYPPIPLLVSGPWTSVEITFDWRSQVDSIPWPVWHGGPVLLSSARVCPFDADWVLDEAGVPLRDSPAEVPVGEQAEEIVKEAAEAAVEPLKSLVWPLALFGMVAGAVYLAVREVKK